MQAMKLLEQYTHVRHEVIRQQNFVHQAAKYANFQEKIITELRQFIHLNLAPTLEILDQMNEDQERARNEANKLNSLESEVDETLSDNENDDTESQKAQKKKDAVMNVFQQKIREVQETNLYTKVREERDSLLIEVEMLRSQADAQGETLEIFSNEKDKDDK